MLGKATRDTILTIYIETHEVTSDDLSNATQRTMMKQEIATRI